MRPEDLGFAVDSIRTVWRRFNERTCPDNRTVARAVSTYGRRLVLDVIEVLADRDQLTPDELQAALAQRTGFARKADKEAGKQRRRVG